MAKSKTATVGGTPTSPAASQYTAWMQNMLGPSGGYTSAINNLLGGSAIGDPTSLTQYFQQMGQQGGAGISPVNYSSQPFATTQFNQPQLSNQQIPGVVNANLQAPTLSNQQMPSWVGGQFQQAPMFNAQGILQGFNPTQFTQAPLAQGQYTNPEWQNPALSNNFQMTAGGIDPNSEYAKAIQQMVQQSQQQGVADLRERFTGTGSSTGTPAAFAEASFRAQAAPQLIAAMEQANQAERGLNLQQMGLANQATLGQNQLLSQLGQAQNQFNQGGAQFGANFGLQQAGMNADIINQMNQLMGQQGLAQNQFGLQAGQLGLQGAGLNADIVNQMNQLMSQQNLAQNQFGQQNAQMGMQQTGMNADIMNQLNQLMLQQSGQQNQYGMQGAQLGMQQTGMNADIMNQLNQMMLQQSGQQNQFNLQNAGQDLNAQMANMQNLMQNQQMMNQYGMGMGNLYQGFTGQNLQAQLGALGPLMQQYSQLLGLGTPQAQTVQKPTTFGNIMGFAGDLTGMAGNLMGGFGGGWNPFGGGGSSMPSPTPYNPYALFGANSYSGGLFGQPPSYNPYIWRP